MGEVAGMLKVDEQTVRRSLKSEALAGFKLPNGWRVASEDLDEFLESRRTGSGKKTR